MKLPLIESLDLRPEPMDEVETMDWDFPSPPLVSVMPVSGILLINCYVLENFGGVWTRPGI